jgi:hypothetical protein
VEPLRQALSLHLPCGFAEFDICSTHIKIKLGAVLIDIHLRVGANRVSGHARFPKTSEIVLTFRERIEEASHFQNSISKHCTFTKRMPRSSPIKGEGTLRNGGL